MSSIHRRAFLQEKKIVVMPAKSRQTMISELKIALRENLAMNAMGYVTILKITRWEVPRHLEASTALSLECGKPAL